MAMHGWILALGFFLGVLHPQAPKGRTIEVLFLTGT